MSYKSYQSYKIKKFINEFFITRSWDNLPSGFPNCSPHGLTTMEADILYAIKLAWMTTGPGRPIFQKRIFKATAVSMAIIFIMALGGIVISQAGKTLAQSVDAATISASLKLGGDILESTASALFK